MRAGASRSSGDLTRSDSPASTGSPFSSKSAPKSSTKSRDRLAELLLVLVGELAAVFDPLQQLGLLGVQAGPQVGEELADALDFDPVEEAAGAGVDRGDLVADAERFALFLFQQLDQPFAAGQRFLGLGVELGAELGEGLEVAVLGEVEAQFSGDLLHRLGLRVAAHPGDRDADVDRRPHAREEEIRTRGRSDRR